jgi:hypothetical protein
MISILVNSTYLFINKDEPDEPEFNVSRLWRDTASNSVWEGTTNVLASETVRHLTKGQNLDLFHVWISNAIHKVSDLALKTTLQAVWSALKSKLEAGQDERGLVGVLGVGRQIIFTLSWLVSGMLLSMDAQRDNNSVAREAARRWVLEGQGVPGEFAFTDLIYQRSALAHERKLTDRERTAWDCRIVWGVDLPSDASAGYRMAKI